MLVRLGALFVAAKGSHKAGGGDEHGEHGDKTGKAHQSGKRLRLAQLLNGEEPPKEDGEGEGNQNLGLKVVVPVLKPPVTNAVGEGGDQNCDGDA